MGQYANIKSRRFYRFLKWLGNNKDVDVVEGGCHPTKVICNNSQESYPLPLSHSEVNKHIIKDFVEWLEKNNVCTKEEFDNHL